MSNDVHAENVLFVARTPIGFHVRVHRSHWHLIVTVKHPVMAGREAEVEKTLIEPDEIRLSRSDSAVYLFYRAEHKKRLVCAVVKQLEEAAFLITTYPTDAVKEGVRVWRK